MCVVAPKLFSESIIMGGLFFFFFIFTIMDITREEELCYIAN